MALLGRTSRTTAIAALRTVLAGLAAAAMLVLAPLATAKTTPPVKPRYAAIVVDGLTGEVLHAEHADALRYPASLTKMMTLFMIFEALDRKKIGLDSEWKVSAFAAGQSPTKLGLQAGRTIAVRDVILGLVTKSANDAAVVAAENLAGTEPAFAAQMTERARKLGLARTTFRNASGLPNPGQVTTAADMARLARALIRSFPQHYAFFSASQFSFAGTTHHNHNRFMQWYDGADGLKTGYIHASGFNLAASAVRHDRRLVGVVLGGPSSGWRDDRMGELMDAAFARKQKDRQPRVAADDAAARGQRTGPGTETAAHAPRAGRPPAPPETSATPRPGWAIQVGAYSEVELAQRAIQQARKLAPTPLQAAATEIQRVGGTGRDANRLRARLTGLGAKAARDACEVLRERGLPCLVVPPGPGVPALAAAPGTG
ncbi:MAG: D-alanyl-D-alanine carboxypeptidase family protein [Rhodospirillales bacterium]|jgi:D-alanyl-D-alanine carboxypeptidase